MSEQTLPQQESMKDYEQELNASFHRYQEGDLVTGTVIGISDTEVTLDLGSYAEGIIRTQDYSQDPSFSIKTDVTLGETVTATVLSEDNGQGSLLLSKTAANELLAWDKLQALMDSKTVLTVKISGIVNSGVVTYVEGIRGFIPASKLSLTYEEDLNHWLNQQIQVQIITVDQSAHKLVLSAKELLKEAETEKQSHLISNIEPGLVTEGVVESLQPYGAFVRLSNGLSGLVHISQISQKRIKTPAAVLSVGQTVTVKIIAIKDQKLSLSMKALEDVAAEEIQEEQIDLPESESISTSLGSLFKGLKID